MTIEARSPEEYLSKLPEPRRRAVARLRDAVKSSLPPGFEERMQYGMISYVVPHAIHPPGYRANPKEPLPFLSIGAQKNHIALYHMGLAAFPEVLSWFRAEYEKADVGKLDMGRACVRFRREEGIPFDLIKALAGKIDVEAYVAKVS